MPTIPEELGDKENIVSYARAVYQAVKTLVQKATEGYDSLINPSRGANPIARCMVDTIRHLAQTDESARSLSERLYFGTRKDRNHTFPVVPFPLTADITIPERELAGSGLTYDSVIDGMRIYGAEVIKTLSLPPEKRKNDRYFRLLTWVFSRLEKREDVSRFYEELPPIRKPLFIDTAISGRASATILQAFDTNDFPVYPLVFVDEDGRRLNTIHRKYFEKRQFSGELETIPMRRIVTEDRGAALLGVYAAFYPQILLAARTMGLPYASAVTWYSIEENTKHPSIEPYRQTFHSFMNLITAVTRGIDSIEKEWGERLETKDLLELLPHRELDSGIEEVIGMIKTHGVPKVEKEPTIRVDFQVPIERAFETHSHVIHIWLPRNYLDEKLNELRNALFH